MEDEERYKKERKLARAIARVFADHFEELMDHMGDPPDLNNIPVGWWDQYSIDVRNAIEPQINDTFFDEFMLGVVGFASVVAIGVASDAALSYVENYTYNLVKGIEKTTRDGVQKR